MTDPSQASEPSDKGPQFDFDAYSPRQMAGRVEAAGVAKANQPILQTAVLGILAGAFIAFGALFYTLTITGSELGFGPTRFLGGVAFSLGLILVVIGGAELFTGNNLIVMAWADHKISLGQLLRNWAVVYVANFIGAIGIAALAALSGVFSLGDGAVGETAAAMASGKLSLGAAEAFTRGVLCNMLVCLAVWLCFAARTVVGKVFAIIFPIAAFVGLGFEHSVANMFVVPVAMMSGAIEWQLAEFLHNLAFVTAGNIVGGSGFVALTYWIVYRPGK